MSYKLILMLFFMTTTSVCSQSLNIEGGLNISGITSKNNSTKYGPGFFVGLKSESNIINKTSVGISIHYNFEGIKINQETERHQHFLRITPHVQLYTPNNVYVSLGLSGGFSTSSKVEFDLGMLFAAAIKVTNKSSLFVKYYHGLKKGYFYKLSGVKNRTIKIGLDYKLK